MVRVLLADNRVDASAESNFAIMWASALGHSDVVDLLLHNARVDAGDQDNAALRYACERGHDCVVCETVVASRVCAYE